MAYTPFTWHDGPGGNTPITAARLNAIEQGLADASEWAEGAQIESHNLDETDPPNGRYIRWANGLQECWWRDSSQHVFPFPPDVSYTTQGIEFFGVYLNWTYPAGFLGNPIWANASVTNFSLESGGRYYGPTDVRPHTLDADDGTFLLVLPRDDDLLLYSNIIYRAIGMWQ